MYKAVAPAARGKMRSGQNISHFGSEIFRTAGGSVFKPLKSGLGLPKACGGRALPLMLPLPMPGPARKGWTK